MNNRNLKKWVAIFLSSWLITLAIGSPSTAILPTPYLVSKPTQPLRNGTSAPSAMAMALQLPAPLQSSLNSISTAPSISTKSATGSATGISTGHNHVLAGNGFLESTQLANRPSHASTASPKANQITAGISAFESGQFAEAIAHWQSALNQLSTSANDRLTQAYLLSNLSAAYQQLGEISQSQSVLSTAQSIITDWSDPTPAYWEVSARVLNAQGQSQWQQGRTQAALTTWQQAEQHYRQATQSASTPTQTTLPASSQAGLVLTQINQALALQELGFNTQAVQQLSTLTQQLPTFSRSVQLSATKELGKALRRIGELSSAQSVLSAALETENKNSPSNSPNNNIDTNSTLTKQQQQTLQLELGHTARALSHRSIAIGQIRPAQTYADQTLEYYTAASLSTNQQASPADELLHTQAQLNQLSYLIEIGNLVTAQTLWPSIQLTELPPSRATTEAYINYAHSLNCLNAPSTTACMKTEWQEALDTRPIPTNTPNTEQQKRMIGALTSALQQAKAQRDSRLEIYAIGELGHAYELSGQLTEAIRLTRQALTLLEGQQMPEIAYRWEWQLARLYRQAPPSSSTTRSNHHSQARIAYQQALSSLTAIRQNLLLVDPQVQFSFRDNVEPIYREFVELLLTPSDRSPSEPSQANTPQGPSQESLALAVQTIDALQLTELENFLGCNLSQLVSLSDPQGQNKNNHPGDRTAITLHPIILSQQLATIVDIPGQPLSLHTVEVDQQTVENTLKDLRDNLVLPGKTPRVLRSAQQLYRWLIEPIEPILSINPQIETLVFVPDGPLRNIPMGVLYDGEQYLIEKDYAIAIAPQLDLFAPRSSPQQLQILRGGIGLPQTVRGQQFPPIELIQAELNQIPNELTVAQPLINENFTQTNIEQQLAQETYSAIHWKTHGVFSSNPSETFLVAYQDGITANELSTLVRAASQQQAAPLELLVLSACATAQGDRRAVLGLAGLAVRAGTRSTLSTLWRADDGANTELMASFYEGLNQGLSKAQALQAAQKVLLNEAGYPAPYYWASYILVGNWL